MALAPGLLAAIGLAILGIGLTAAAFIGEGVGPLRLGFGIALVVAALITAGLQLLSRNTGSYGHDHAEEA
jgi:hypothetical protein